MSALALRRAAEEAAKYNKVNIAATGKPGKFTGARMLQCAQASGGPKPAAHAHATTCRHPAAELVELDARRCVRAHLRQRDHRRR